MDEDEDGSEELQPWIPEDVMGWIFAESGNAPNELVNFTEQVYGDYLAGIPGLIITDLSLVYLPMIQAIEDSCFSYPLRGEEVTNFLVNPKKRCKVALNSEMHAIGFVAYEIFRNRAEILSLAVMRKYRRQGLGSLLLSDMRLMCKKPLVLGMVREYNVSGQLFLKSQGFICSEIVKRPFESHDEDGYLFRHFSTELLEKTT